MRPCDLDGRWKSWPWFLGVRRSDWDCMWCIIGPPIPKATKAPPSVMGQNVRFPLVLTLGLGIALAIPATAGTPDWSLLECKALQTRTSTLAILLVATTGPRDIQIHGFPRINGDFPMKNGDFPMNKLWFSKDLGWCLLPWIPWVDDKPWWTWLVGQPWPGDPMANPWLLPSYCPGLNRDDNKQQAPFSPTTCTSMIRMCIMCLIIYNLAEILDSYCIYRYFTWYHHEILSPLLAKEWSHQMSHQYMWFSTELLLVIPWYSHGNSSQKLSPISYWFNLHFMTLVIDGCWLFASACFSIHTKNCIPSCGCFLKYNCTPKNRWLLYFMEKSPSQIRRMTGGTPRTQESLICIPQNVPSVFHLPTFW